MALPKFLQPYLASYDLTKLDIKRDKKLIITQVLNKGNYSALRWLGKTYSQKEMRETINDFVSRFFTDKAFVFFYLILLVVVFSLSLVDLLFQMLAVYLMSLWFCALITRIIKKGLKGALENS